MYWTYCRTVVYWQRPSFASVTFGEADLDHDKFPPVKLTCCSVPALVVVVPVVERLGKVS
jgi:hypothetical protein